MGMLVLSSEAKELCLESWAFAARALFQRALISMEARYNVWGGREMRQLENTLKKTKQKKHNFRLCFYLLCVSTGVEAWHQVENVSERHWIQVFDERREKVVDVAATVFELNRKTKQF